MKHKPLHSLSTPILISVLCASLVAQPSRVLAAPNDMAGFGNAATMGTSPPEGQTVANDDIKVASRTGAYEYEYAISVPPGRLSMQPNLALRYNSQGDLYGGIASNWTLSIPEMRVDYSNGRLATLLTPDHELPWKSDLAGGHRLVPAQEPSSPGSTPYRAIYDDSYVRYEKFPESMADGPLWLARTLEGKILYFGDSAQIRTRKNNPAYLGDRAPLTREEDRFGNTVDYYWTTDEPAGSDDVNSSPSSYQLERIEYTKNVSVAGGTHFAEVRFNYGPAMYCKGAAIPVGAKSDHHGPVLRIDGKEPLESIVTYVADTPGSAMRETRRVNLEYVDKTLCQSNESPIRQLASITEVGTDIDGVEVQANPVTFKYGPTSLGFTSISAFDASGPSTGNTLYPNAITWGERGSNPTIQSQLIDLDGDGRLDRIFSDLPSNGFYDGRAANSSEAMDGCGMVWLRNDGTKFADDDISVSTSDSVVPIKLPKIGWASGGATPGIGEGCSLTGQLTTQTNIPDADSCGQQGSTLLAYRFMDVDGDGLPDLVTGLHYNRSSYDPLADPTYSNHAIALPYESPAEIPHPGGEAFNPNTASSKYLLDCDVRGICRFNVAMVNMLVARFNAAVYGDPAANIAFSQGIGDDAGDDPGTCETFEPNCKCHDPSECCEASEQSCCGGPDVWGSEDDGACDDTPTNPDDSTPQPDPPSDPWEPNPDPPQEPDYPQDIPPGGSTCSSPMVPDKTSGRFVLHWYRNHGPKAGFFKLAQRTRMESPISLDPLTGDSENGVVTTTTPKMQHNPSTFTDIDGDGIIDAVWSDGFNNTHDTSTGTAPSPDNPLLIWSVHTGNGRGRFVRNEQYQLPFPWVVPEGARVGSALSSLGIYNAKPQVRSLASTELADMNADGLLDLVYWYNWNPATLGSSNFVSQFGSARIYLNTGHGFRRSFNLNNDPPLTHEPFSAPSLSAFDQVTLANGRIESGTGKSLVRLSDFDSDGRPDLLVRHSLVGPYPPANTNFLASIPAKLFVNPGLDTLLTPTLSSPTVTAPGFMAHDTVVSSVDWQVRGDFLDLNGDGQSENVSASGATGMQMAGRPAGNGPLRLLKQIDNGRGKITEISYAPQNDPSVAASTQTGKAVMPSHLWVVKEVKRSDLVSDTTGVVEVKYGDPVWNQEQHPVWHTEKPGKWAFRGFTSIETSSPHTPSATSGFTVTEQKYDYGIDWSGRVAETVVYTDALAKSKVASISSQSWQPRSLFDDATLSYVVASEQTYNCENNSGAFLSYIACKNSPALHETQNTWSSIKSKYAASSGDPSLAFHLTATEKGNGGNVDDGDIRQSTANELLSSDSQYWLAPSASTTVVWDTNAYVPIGETRYRLDSSELYVDRVESFTGSTSFYAGTTIDTATGLTLKETKPEQYSLALPKVYGYAGFKVSPDSITNELGDKSSATVDLATGAVLATSSPNTITCSQTSGPEGSRSTVDGFGRTIDVFARGCPSSSSFGEYKVSHTDYSDYSPGSPASVTTTTYQDFAQTEPIVSQVFYDGHGRLVQSREVLDVGEANTFIQYNDRGHLTRHSAPNPKYDSDLVRSDFTFAYDSLGRSTGMRVADASGAAPDPGSANWQNFVGVDIAYSFQEGLSITTKMEHVVDGQPEAMTRTYNDLFGRLVQVDELTDSGLATTRYDYDGNNNLRYIQDADGFETFMEHNWLSQRTAIRRGSRVWRFDYNRNGQVIVETAPVPAGGITANYQTSYAHDALDRVTSVVAAPAGLSSADQKLFGIHRATIYNYDSGYNGIGRLSSVAGPFFNRIYTYDSAGNIATEGFEYAASTIANDGSVAGYYEQSAVFNAAGNITRLQTADGQVLSYEHDARGRQDSLVWENSQIPNHEVADFKRNVAGNVVHQRSGCIARTWAYDSLARVTQTRVVRDGNLCDTTGPSYSTQGTKLAENLSYFNNSNVKRLGVSRETLANRIFTFDYDFQHQLVSANDNLQSSSYSAVLSYSGAGRVLSADIADIPGAPLVVGRNVDYKYGPHKGAGAADGHAVEQLQDANSGAPHTTYGFDISGNVTKRIEESQSATWNFTYDGFDRQRRVVGPKGNEELYFYDENGQRYLSVERNQGKVVRSRLWFGATEFWRDRFGSAEKTITRLTLGGNSVARLDTEEGSGQETLEYTFQNGLGHLMGTVDSGGTLTTAFVYGPYGEIIEQTGDTETHLRRFNGKDADQLSKLNYYGYRYYDPLSLTWTQADPLYRVAPDIAYDEPRRMSLYMFSGNNPVRYVDPDGKDFGDWVIRVNNRYRVEDKAHRVGKVSTGFLIAAGGCAASAGAGCVAAVAYGADYAASGVTNDSSVFDSGVEAAGGDPETFNMFAQATFGGFAMAQVAVNTPRIAAFSMEAEAAAAEANAASRGAGGPLRPTQKAVSGPQVDRLAAGMKKNGFDPLKPVKVDGDLVVDGHHRVMAAKKAGVEPVTTPGTASNASKANALDGFDDIKVDSVDWYE